MRAHAAAALLHAAAVLVAAFLIAFLLLHTLPGDPTGMRESAAIPVELLDRNRLDRHHLDRLGHLDRHRLGRRHQDHLVPYGFPYTW